MIEHIPRLSHNWDRIGDRFECTDMDSFHFSILNALCVGCGGYVDVALAEEEGKRWAPDLAPWVVDKIYNEVIFPCGCRQCEHRRRTFGNYEGLSGPLGCLDL